MSMMDLLLKDFYQEQSLSSEKLESIKGSMLDESKNKDTIHQTEVTNSRVASPSSYQHNSRQNMRKGLFTLAFILVMLIPLALVINTGKQKHRLINEIVLNHQKPFIADVVGSDFVKIQNDLSAVNFDINVPVHIRGKYQLLGARYCSLANQLAIQLQLLDKKTQKKSSLFITPLSEEVRPFSSNVNNGVNYASHYWSNQSLFYALLSENTL